MRSYVMLGKCLPIAIVMGVLVCVVAIACGNDSEDGVTKEAAVQGAAIIETTKMPYPTVPSTVGNTALPTATVPITPSPTPFIVTPEPVTPTPQSDSEADKKLMEIVLGTIEAMKEVESFHFEERYEQYSIWGDTKERQFYQPFFSASGDFHRPGRTHKIGVFEYTDSANYGRGLAFSEHSEAFRYDVVNIDSSTYLSQTSSGRFGPYYTPFPVEFYDGTFWGNSRENIALLRRNPLSPLISLPSSMWARERSLKSRQISLESKTIGGVAMHYIESTTVTDDQVTRKTTRIKIWIGEQDLLVRELVREVDTTQGHCDFTKQACPDIQIDPITEIDRFVFSDYGQDVGIELPNLTERVSVPSSLGPMAVYEGASGTFSMLYPSNQYLPDVYTIQWPMHDGDVFYRRQGYLKSIHGDDSYIFIRPLYYDEVSISQSPEYTLCTDNSPDESSETVCNALETFLATINNGEASIEDYVDYWKAWKWAPPGWGNLPAGSNFRIRSQQTIEPAEGLTGEIFEITARPGGAGGWLKSFRLALYLYELHEPIQGCHPESKRCYVLVLALYGESAKVLTALSDAISYSFHSFRLHPLEETSIAP